MLNLYEGYRKIFWILNFLTGNSFSQHSLNPRQTDDVTTIAAYPLAGCFRGMGSWKSVAVSFAEWVVT